AEKLDPEEVHQIIDRCFEPITAEVHRFEGTINQYTGDVVMALGNGPFDRYYAHHCRGDDRLGSAGSAGRTTRHHSGARAGLARRTRWLWPVMSAARAAVVVRASSRPGHTQLGVDPPSADPVGSGSTRGGRPGHHAPGEVGSLADRYRRGRPYAPDWLGRDPVSVAHRALPGH